MIRAPKVSIELCLWRPVQSPLFQNRTAQAYEFPAHRRRTQSRNESRVASAAPHSPN
jgi:hypothetical protein